MSKLGVLLTICLLLFPLTALPLDGDQPADRPTERMKSDVEHYLNLQIRRCCPLRTCSVNCRSCCAG
nr:conotoxin precursor M [Conus judaeus]